MEYAQSGYVSKIATPATYGNMRSNEAPAEAIENSKVRDAITSAEQLQSDIHEAIGYLERRLETVLRPVPPQGQSGANVATPTPLCSHVTGRLNLLNEGLAAVVGRLRELRDRAEV